MRRFKAGSVSVIERTWHEFWEMLSKIPKTAIWDGKPYVPKPFFENAYLNDRMFFDDHSVQLREEGCYLEVMGIAKLVKE